MSRADRSSPMERPGFTIGYDLGTVGTWVRILVGVVASLAFLSINVASDQPAASFIWQTSLWFLGILAAYTVVYVLLAPRVLPRLNPWVSTVIFYGPVLVLPYVDALPDAFRVALTLYIILSIVVVVFVRYGAAKSSASPRCSSANAMWCTAHGTPSTSWTKPSRTLDGVSICRVCR